MDWRRGKILGRGSSATVHLAAVADEITAVKSSEVSKSLFLQKEQSIISTLSSPHIISYKGYDITNESNNLYYNIFMEYMPFGSVLQTVQRHGGRLNIEIVKFYTLQILKGLEYLHAKGLVHCDIKSSNILVNQYGVKISDFGCAKWIDDTSAPISGTPMFMSPEAARGEEQGFASDVWSLGCALIEFSCGVLPWPNMWDPNSVLYRIAYSGESPEIPGWLPEEGRDFLEKCFMRDPRERWTASQLLDHPFVNEFHLKDVERVIQRLNSSSPTCVLEQEVWNCSQELESEENLIHMGVENSVADDIIRMLAENSGDASWTCDHTWIIVR